MFCNLGKYQSGLYTQVYCEFGFSANMNAITLKLIGIEIQHNSMQYLLHTLLIYRNSSQTFTDFYLRKDMHKY